MRVTWKVNFMIIMLLCVVALLGLASRDSAVASQESSEKIEGLLLDQFTTDGSADFIMRFSEQADLSAAYTMEWSARGEYVYNTLRETAERSQANAKAILDAQGQKYQTFIAGNDLYVWGGSQMAINGLSVLNELAALPEVSFIRATRTYYIDPVVDVKPLENITWVGDLLASGLITSVAAPDAIEWGISNTKADTFWTTFGHSGDGVIVANIDTGVRYTHEALYSKYKCGSGPHTSCWFDPTGGTTVPTDDHGHGTHTMGTMVGSAGANQIGMAPSATWIACDGCDGTNCTDYDLNSCADWILAPGGSSTNRPNVVNNSWGGGGGNTWYLAKVNAWRAAGIFPAFSAGNSGSGCSTLGSPGDYQESFGSAAHDSGRTIASFSSRGPSAFGHDPYTKPNISAPGVSVRSSLNGSNTSYGTMSGTSMASPHTAGAVALLWSCDPALKGQIDTTFQLLLNNADAAPSGSCGAPPDGQGNNTYGYGYLNVLNAGVAACGGVEIGHLNGHVHDNGGNPIEGATVSALSITEGNQILATTDPNGYYAMNLIVGTYNVTASKVNYAPQTTFGVVISADTTTTKDFTLTYLGTWTQIVLPSGCPDWTRFDGEYYPGTGKVYFLGGRAGTTTDGNIYSFDPVTRGCADTGANMGNPISNYTIVLLNDGSADLLCTFGGRDSTGNMTNVVQCYNPVANSVITKANLPSAFDTFLPGGVAVVNNKAYIFGGYRQTSPYNTNVTYEYDPIANNYSVRGNLSLARGYIDVAVADSKIYGFGGVVYDGTNLNAQTKTEVFDPVTGTWNDASIADLSAATGEGRAYGFDSDSMYELAGKIILAGGGQWPAESNEAISYDVASNTYTSFVNLNISRRDQAGFFVPGIPGIMWVFGGRSGASGYGGDNPPYAPPEYYNVTGEGYYIHLPFIVK